jgi:hypothetical protein
MKLTKIEIINETFEFYSKNPQLRSVGAYGGMCSYNGGGGKHCAVGRCLLKKYQKQGSKLKRNTSDLYSFLDEHDLDINSMLQPKYRGHGMSFWRDLQSLHDTHSNWYDNGITELGRKEVETLIVIHSGQ